MQTSTFVKPKLLVSATSFLQHPLLCQALQEALPFVEITWYRGAVDAASLSTALQGHLAWLIGREKADHQLLQQVPQLQFLAKYGVGLDNIDLASCQQLGKTVLWEAGVNRDAVAEHSLGLMLSCLRNIGQSSRLLAQGHWWKRGGRSLFHRTVGIIGFGHIGKRLAELLRPFDCRILVHDILDVREEAKARQAEQLSYQEVLRQSEILSFHVSLLKQSYHMYGVEELKLSKAGVVIINSSRGEVIETEALKKALQSGHVSAAGLDVFEEEPLTDADLYQIPTLIATPHTAGNSEEAVWAMGQAAIRGLQKELGKLAKSSDLI